MINKKDDKYFIRLYVTMFWYFYSISLRIKWQNVNVNNIIMSLPTAFISTDD